MKYIALILLLNISLWSSCSANEKVVNYIKPQSSNDLRHEYYFKLLTLALAKGSNQTTSFELRESTHHMTQDRGIQQLANGREIDVIGSTTSNAIEKLLKPIRIPLVKGLLGYRVLIIKKGDQDKFDAIESVEELRQYTAGQGHDWPSTKVLQANGIRVSTTSSYEGLFNMLKAGRFDFFPRGMTEAWLELAAHKGLGLAVEKTLLLYYPSPVYFFVNKENTQLAEAIETGLLRAIEDGSFDQLFHSHYSHKEMFTLAKLEHRTVIYLQNPLFPAKTPINNRKLSITGPATYWKNSIVSSRHSESN